MYNPDQKINNLFLKAIWIVLDRLKGKLIWSMDSLYKNGL